MFVRWQTYRSKARSPQLRIINDKDPRLKAILVESLRINGKPRQRHIAFLSSISLDRRNGFACRRRSTRHGLLVLAAHMAQGALDKGKRPDRG